MVHAGAAALAVLLLASPGQAQAQRAAEASTGPFGHLSGAWTGSGVIKMSNGANERIRCRVKYVVQNGGNALQQELRCASDSYRFELTSNVVQNGDSSITGTWSEATRNLGGSLSGRISSGSIQARAESPTFTALLAVNTRGDRQSVSIQSPGSEVSEVSISLSRR
jgi:hypothetical protein